MDELPAVTRRGFRQEPGTEVDADAMVGTVPRFEIEGLTEIERSPFKLEA